LKEFDRIVPGETLVAHTWMTNARWESVMPVYKPEGEKNYRIQFRIAGKTYVKSAKTADKRVAERMEAEWKAEIHGGVYLKNREPITVSQMFDNYLALPLAETTKKGARTFFRLFRKFTHCNVKAHEFNQGELDKYVTARRAAGKKESGIRTHILIFMGAWNRTNNKVYNVPALEAPKLATPKYTTKYLTPEQEQMLTDYLLTRRPHAGGTGDWKYEMHDLVFLYLDTGARYCEIARLEWEQVDLQKKTIELWRNKTKSESFVYMTDRVHQILQQRAEKKIHERWVFTNGDRTNHRRLSTTSLNDAIRKSGVDSSVHKLRHAYATKMLKAGLTLNDVRLLLGHSSIQTTQRYQHLESNDVSPKAVAILNQQNVERNRSKLKVVGGKN
jgi:site-specific recombinase XerD